jgi:hypothetical protein
VLAGPGNQACETYSAIGAGQANVSGAGSPSESFIGAGNNNQISSGGSIIGAGSDNEAGGSNSFVGAGNFNYAAGIASFVGAGGQETQNAVVGAETWPAARTRSSAPAI